MLFSPKIKTVGQVPGLRPLKDISHEPMIFSGDYEFARGNGGSLTQEFLSALEQSEEFKSCWINHLNGYPYLVIDSRVTQTMIGQYPSMPGWHCDDVPRSGYGQPDISRIDDNIQHFMCILSTADNHTCTEFITEDTEVEIDHNDVWGSLDRNIKPNKTKRIKPGEIIKFNQTAIHRATETIEAGWRFFIRASFTYREPKNEIRKQVQIYVGRNGW